MGRPSLYSPELAESILLRMCSGESLRQICKSDDMPERSTVNLWRLKHDEFSIQYARARRMQVEARIEEANDIADDGTNDYDEVDIGDGVTVSKLNSEHVQRSKLRCEQRRWEASKLLRGPINAPLDYGDRTTVAGDPDAPIGVQYSVKSILDKE